VDAHVPANVVPSSLKASHGLPASLPGNAAGSARSGPRLTVIAARAVGQHGPDRAGQRSTQSACFRKNAGISISSMPLLASASTFAAACVRPVRQTLGTAIWL
jgi:hypothetical protein